MRQKVYTIRKMDKIRTFLNEFNIPFNDENRDESYDLKIFKYKIRVMKKYQTIDIYNQMNCFDHIYYYLLYTFYNNDENIDRIKLIILSKIVDPSYLFDMNCELDRLNNIYFNISNEKLKIYTPDVAFDFLDKTKCFVHPNKWNPIEIIKQLKNKINEHLSLYEPETGPLFLMSQEWFEMIIE